MDLSFRRGRLVLYPLRPQRKKNGTERRSHTRRQCAGWLLARPRAVSWQSTGPDVTVVVPALEKVLLQEMDAEKGGKKTGAEQKRIVLCLAEDPVKAV